jgi:ribosomal protein S12 methylthiotransferase accessory factor
VKVNFLDKLPKLEAKFDDFHGGGRSAHPLQGRWLGAGAVRLLSGLIGLVRGLLCEVVLRHAQYSTDNIRLSQNNIVDPENRYKQIFKIQVELPADISAKDRQGILRSIERCTVKKVVQTGPEFVIEEVRTWMPMPRHC